MGSLVRIAILICFAAFMTMFVSTVYSGSTSRRLTTTADVLSFTWSSSGDALYVTRAGGFVELSPKRQQLTGDLYRAELSGRAELLARNANEASPSPDDRSIAFARLGADGRAALLLLDRKSNIEQVLGPIEWGIRPQWNRSSGEVLYARNGLVARGTNGNDRNITSTALPRGAAISPIGDAVAFVRPDGLWIWSSGSVRRVLQSDQNESLQFDLSWAHDGTRLAFIVSQAGLVPALWLFDITSGETRQLARGELEHFANPAWSADDVYVIWSRMPTGSSGSNSSEIWRVPADSTQGEALTENRAEESTPQYSPDGSRVAFLRGGDVWVVELDARGRARDDLPIGGDLTIPSPSNQSAAGQLLPPSVIRVRHDAANSCRDAVVGQIDIIDFETYVKQVLPAEVFASWNIEALKTQAVAAQSYAWFWILQHPSWSYDVTDSTAYQYMCDTRYAATDAAVDETRGQYAAYAGQVIFAAYGAENGDPTLTNSWGNPYLIGVDDPVGFMRTRVGNALGMSQWGAQRWASTYGWSYQQILAHYYTGITIEAPAGKAPDEISPIGAISEPWSNWGVTTNRINLIVNASDDSSNLAAVDLEAQYFDGESVRNQTIAELGAQGRQFTWDVSHIPDQTGIVVTPHLQDSAGNQFSGNSITFDLDRQLPRGSVSAPPFTDDAQITLDVAASDQGPSGLVGMAFSNNWIWEGENQVVQNNSATVVSDSDALNGKALRGLPDVNPPGAWYGPYTTILPGDTPYRAYFRLKTDSPTLSDMIALLDVAADNGGTVLGLKRLRGTDFRNLAEYQEFYVDFFAHNSQELEFRVTYYATASLWLDRILVVSYPVPFAATADWILTAGDGLKTVQAKFLDAAANSSPDATTTVTLGFGAPTPTPTLLPRFWLPFIVR